MSVDQIEVERQAVLLEENKSHGDPDPVRPAAWLRAIIFGYGALLLAGLVFGIFLEGDPSSARTPGPSGNIFTYLFAFNEPIACAIHLLSLLVLYRWYQAGASLPGWLRTSDLGGSKMVILISLAAVLVGSAGTFAVFHRYPLAMDEYLADFQAKIFASGRITAEVPEAWREFVPWLNPIFVLYNPDTHAWTSQYLPVYGALRAIAMLAGAEWLLNPLLAGISIFSISRIARRLWPEQRSAPLIAGALLLSSAQFLITSMTAYSMPAHLCFNLVWLWLFTMPGNTGKLLAPWLGLLAVGLHQPNVHLLFAIPFGIRFLLSKKWQWAAYYLIAYCIALLVWRQWWAIFRPTIVGEAMPFFAWPGLAQIKLQFMNLVLLASWQSLAVGILAAIAIRNWKQLPPIVRDLAMGCLITFAAYFFFDSDQGHGWGYRYFYAVLGNLVLVAAAGWITLKNAADQQICTRLVFASAIVSLAVLLPVRAWQAENLVAPFARANEAIQSSTATSVLVPVFDGWYAQDLVRNDPFLSHGPKVLRYLGIDQARFQLLREHGPVVALSVEAMTKMGIVTEANSHP